MPSLPTLGWGSATGSRRTLLSARYFRWLTKPKAFLGHPASKAADTPPTQRCGELPLFTRVRGRCILRSRLYGGSRKSVSRTLYEAQQSPTEKMTRVSLSSHRLKPDLAIWAHQARKISGQALESCRRT